MVGNTWLARIWCNRTLHLYLRIFTLTGIVFREALIHRGPVSKRRLQLVVCVCVCGAVLGVSGPLNTAVPLRHTECSPIVPTALVVVQVWHGVMGDCLHIWFALGAGR